MFHLLIVAVSYMVRMVKTNALGHQNPFLINQNLENSNIKESKL